MNSTVTIRLSEEEERILSEYSNNHNIDMATSIKQLALERIQDEQDLVVAQHFENGISDGSITIKPYDELLKETGISS